MKLKTEDLITMAIKHQTKKELLKELEQLRKRIAKLETSEVMHQVTEKTLQISHRFLEITFQNTEMNSLLNEFVKEVKNFAGCTAVGIRLLDSEGNIPYQAYKGFSKRFYESESPLSIKTDQCMCINVIKGTTDPALPFYTEGGSFYMNGTTRFLATILEEEKGQTRNVCNEFGYESVALVPIQMMDHTLGLIHLADLEENMIPIETVKILEGSARQLGVSIERVRISEHLKLSLDEKAILLKEVHHRVKNNLQIISSFLDLSDMRIQDQQAIDFLTGARTKIYTLALVHSRLYQNEKFDKIEMEGFIQELIGYLSNIYEKSKFVNSVLEISNVCLPINQALTTALVLNELISNVFKHAFKEKQEGTIEISMQRTAEDMVLMKVKDDGLGIRHDIDIYKTNSLGLKLVRNLVQKQLHGNIKVMRDKGTEYVIEFKIFAA